MSIQRLPVFLSAAEHLNFTKAAKELCVSQTAVSQQIKLLEEEIGFPLFVRENRSVSLTLAGESFYRQCKMLMTQYHSAILQGQRIATDSLNALRIGYASAYELWTMAKLVKLYRKTYPKRQIEFHASNDQSLLDQITEGKIDMAVITGVELDLTEWIAAKTIASDPCRLMISARHPLASRKSIDPRELGDIPVVYNSGKNYLTDLTQIDRMYTYLGLGGNKRIYANDFSSMVLIVSMGQAISVMPYGLKDMGINGLAFLPIKGFHRTARTLAVYPRHTAAPAVQNLLRLLRLCV